MKKYIFKLVLFVSILLVGNNSYAQTAAINPDSFVAEHGKLSVQGTSLVDQHGEKLILRGASLGWHHWWYRFYDKQTVDWLTQDWNINVIRAAIGVELEGAYLDNPTLAMDCLYKVVDTAIEDGIYVIIDWHSHNIRLEEAKGFFTEVATKYRGYPNIIYEIFNEPEYNSWEEVKQYSEEVIKTIRSIDADNIILVGVPHWSQDVDIAADNPIEGYDNIMYTLHFYAATHKEELRKKADYALSKGLPIFVSECAGMEATGDGPIDYEQWEKWLEWMKKNNLSYAIWSVSDKDETCSMIKDKSSPISGWTNNDLKEWGIITRNTLRSGK